MCIYYIVYLKYNLIQNLNDYSLNKCLILYKMYLHLNNFFNLYNKLYLKSNIWICLIDLTLHILTKSYIQ